MCYYVYNIIRNKKRVKMSSPADNISSSNYDHFDDFPTLDILTDYLDYDYLNDAQPEVVEIPHESPRVDLAASTLQRLGIHNPNYAPHELDYVADLTDQTLSDWQEKPAQYLYSNSISDILDRGAHPEAVIDVIGDDHDNIISNVDAFLNNGVSPDDLFTKVDHDKLEQKYGYDAFLGKLIEAGGDPIKIIPKMYEGYLFNEFDSLVEKGVSPQLLADNLDNYLKIRSFEKLKELGVDVDIQEIADNLSTNDKALYIDKLIKNGAKIDVPQFIDELILSGQANAILLNIHHFKDAAPDIDFQSIVDGLNASDRLYNVEVLQQNGITVDGAQLLEDLKQSEAVLESQNIKNLLITGADPDEVLRFYKENPHSDVLRSFEYFAAAGAKLTSPGVARLINQQDANTKAYLLTTLQAIGAKVNVNKIANELDDSDFSERLGELLKGGLPINRYLDRLDAQSTKKNYNALLAAGVKQKVLEQKIA